MKPFLLSRGESPKQIPTTVYVPLCGFTHY
jgi:hypothetical protein